MNESYFNSGKNTVLSSKPSTAIGLLLMVLFVSITPLVSFGQSQTFNSSGTFIVPAGVTSVNVQVWGAGGAGGGSTSDGNSGAGGGAGGYSYGTLAVTPGTSILYTVGAGGIGSTGNGASGGNSSFLTITANGGDGGRANGGSVGTGGTASGGSTNTTGGSGNGGGSNMGGKGGNAPAGGGTGGNGNSNNDGSIGNSPGGGGGGGEANRYYDWKWYDWFNYTTDSYAGGNGGKGQIKISWASCPTYSLTGSNTATATCVSDGTSTITLKGTATSLPLGTYTVTYNTDVPYQSGKTATMTVSTAGTGTFTATGLTLYSGASGISTVTVTNISLGSCSNAVSANNTVAVTVYATPVGGGIYTGNTSICINSSTGNMTVTGYTGSIVRWEKRLTSSATWTTIANTTATYFESPSIAGTWEYRALVGSGSCTSVYSAVRQVVVNPASVGGTVSGGSTPICQGTSTGTLTLSGYTGTILRWEKQVNSGGWNYAGGGSATFSEFATAGTCEYRAVVQSGSCATANSSSVTIVVSPTPVGGGIYTGNTPICINSSTGSMNLTGYTGSVVRWEKRLLPATTWTNIANTTDTYSESPSVGGTWEYRALVGSGSCATVYSSIKQVIVNPELTITLTNSNSSVCQNSTTASFAYSATTGSPAACSVDFDSAANTAGFTDLSYIGLGGAPNTFSVNVPWAAAAGVYNATLTLKTDWPSCTSTVSYPITVTVGVSTPVVGTITHPNCTVPTGSVVLSGLPASGTIYQTGTVVTNFPITGTSMTISGLAAGSYNFSASNGTCTSSTTGNVIINPAVTNTWNGSAWSNGMPNSDQKIVFSGNYNSSGDITACSCTVTGNTKVIINSGHTLTITNEVKVVGSGPGAGSLTFENNASLVQINNAAVNSGNITYNRVTTTQVRNTDYTYWSTPVSPLKLAGVGGIEYSSIALTGSIFYSYLVTSTTEGWKSESASTPMVAGQGYGIRGPGAIATTLVGFLGVSFTGVPNNGNYSIPIAKTNASYLLGNPYPSAIDADAFLTDNSAVLDGTLYFWTHNSVIQDRNNIISTAGTGAYAYTSDDYAAYNKTGGTASALSDPLNPVGKIPTGKIAAGQGFFATSSVASGNIVFNNAMRLISNAPINNTQFFKTKNPNKKTTNIIEKHRIWLNMTNKEGAFKQTLVGYVTDATNDYDGRFDGESLDGNDFIDFYSINEDKNLVIQGRALPFDEKDEVPLGYKTTIEGDFTINIDETDGLLANQEVFLEDILTNKTVNLKQGNYTFSTAAGTFDDRFVLKYSSKTLGVDSPQDKEDGIIALYSNADKTIIIRNNGDATIHSVSLFGMSGQNIAVWDLKNKEQTNIQLPTKELSSGIYILKMKTTTGESGKKIIVN